MLDGEKKSKGQSTNRALSEDAPSRASGSDIKSRRKKLCWRGKAPSLLKVCLLMRKRGGPSEVDKIGQRKVVPTLMENFHRKSIGLGNLSRTSQSRRGRPLSFLRDSQ